MKHCICLLLALFLGTAAWAQSDLVKAAQKMKPGKEFDNVLVELLFSDELSSSFVVWIKSGVALHKHEAHTEQVYVLKGKGRMVLGEEELEVRKGDVIFIPKGTPHGVKVKSGILKVISVQSPRFVGKDRIFLE